MTLLKIVHLVDAAQRKAEEYNRNTKTQHEIGYELGSEARRCGIKDEKRSPDNVLSCRTPCLLVFLVLAENLAELAGKLLARTDHKHLNNKTTKASAKEQKCR